MVLGTDQQSISTRIHRFSYINWTDEQKGAYFGLFYTMFEAEGTAQALGALQK